MNTNKIMLKYTSGTRLHGRKFHFKNSSKEVKSYFSQNKVILPNICSSCFIPPWGSLKFENMTSQKVFRCNVHGLSPGRQFSWWIMHQHMVALFLYQVAHHLVPHCSPPPPLHFSNPGAPVAVHNPMTFTVGETVSLESCGKYPTSLYPTPFLPQQLCKFVLPQEEILLMVAKLTTCINLPIWNWKEPGFC